MRGTTWAWLVALSAGTTVLAAPSAALADNPDGWGVSDHSTAGIGPATSSAPAPAPPPAAPRTTTARTTTRRTTPARTSEPVRPPPETTTTRRVATTTPPATSRPTSPPPAAVPTASLSAQPPPPGDTAPSPTSAPTPPPTTAPGIDVGWTPLPSASSSPTPTPSTPTPSSSAPPSSTPAPSIAATDGDLDLDLTPTVTAGDPSWDRAASGTDLAAWTTTVQSLAAARAGHRGTTYLRLDVPLPSTGATAVAPATFRQVWRSLADVAHRAFPQARLVATVVAGRDTPDALAPYWPGDDQVDVVGVLARVATPDEARTVESLSDPRGLASWLGFGAAHGRPIGVPDWGIDGGPTTTDGVTFVRWMQAAITANAAAPGQTAGRVLYAPVLPATAPTEPADSPPPPPPPSPSPSSATTTPATPTPTPTPTAARTTAPSSTTASSTPPPVWSSGS